MNTYNTLQNENMKTALETEALARSLASGKTLVNMSDHSPRPGTGFYARICRDGKIVFANCKRKNVNKYLPAN